VRAAARGNRELNEAGLHPRLRAQWALPERGRGGLPFGRGIRQLPQDGRRGNACPTQPRLALVIVIDE
jgi:hypothetical protein